MSGGLRVRCDLNNTPGSPAKQWEPKSAGVWVWRESGLEEVGKGLNGSVCVFPPSLGDTEPSSNLSLSGRPTPTGPTCKKKFKTQGSCLFLSLHPDAGTLGPNVCGRHAHQASSQKRDWPTSFENIEVMLLVAICCWSVLQRHCVLVSSVSEKHVHIFSCIFKVFLGIHPFSISAGIFIAHHAMTVIHWLCPPLGRHSAVISGPRCVALGGRNTLCFILICAGFTRECVCVHYFVFLKLATLVTTISPILLNQVDV